MFEINHMAMTFNVHGVYFMLLQINIFLLQSTCSSWANGKTLYVFLKLQINIFPLQPTYFSWANGKTLFIFLKLTSPMGSSSAAITYCWSGAAFAKKTPGWNKFFIYSYFYEPKEIYSSFIHIFINRRKLIIPLFKGKTINDIESWSPIPWIT